jgi:hypothetical protein
MAELERGNKQYFNSGLMIKTNYTASFKYILTGIRNKVWKTYGDQDDKLWLYPSIC